jgi:hypothetical protein
MNAFRTIVSVCALIAIACAATAAQAAPLRKQSGARADELSAAARVQHRRHGPAYHGQPYYVSRYSAYRRGADPALGPDGRPYRPPAYLRGQCYIDEGYGRFSACPNR